MIELRGVRQSAGGRQLLDGVFLRIDAGQVVLIEGGMGSGRSLLLEILAARRLPQEGDVKIFDRDVVRLRDSSLARLRRRVQLVGEELAFFERDTALSNCAVPLELAGRPHSERCKRARAALSVVGLLAVADARADSLSSGERRQLAVARALVAEPAALVLDEPSAGMSPRDAGRVVELLDSVRWGGLAIVVATNDSTLHAAAERHSWRHLELSGGTLEPSVGEEMSSGQILPFPSLLRVSSIGG